MNTVVIEHVPITELPPAWQERLGGALEARVTVLIEPKSESEISLKDATPPEFADDPSFGMWRDREDMADVEAYMRRIRAPRVPREPSSDEH